MISIIICSASRDDLRAVQKNITDTIGIDHEIIAIDNSVRRAGICEIYNEGTQQAKYDLLCFMHEDVEIRTLNWGEKVVELFEAHAKLGILGVAGGGYKSLAPEGWYQFEFHNLERSYQNVIQGYKYNRNDELHAYHNPRNENLSSVVCVDGLWFCTRKHIALKYMFDEKLLRGFHGYDIDFCLQVFPHYEIMVTFEILMKHASEGNFDKKWLDEMLRLHRKWSPVLPLTTSSMQWKEDYFVEKRSFTKLIGQMLEWGYSWGAIQRMLFGIIRSKSAKNKLFFKMSWHLVTQVWNRPRLHNPS